MKLGAPAPHTLVAIAAVVAAVRHAVIAKDHQHRVVSQLLDDARNDIIHLQKVKGATLRAGEWKMTETAALSRNTPTWYARASGESKSRRIEVCIVITRSENQAEMAGLYA